MLLQGVRLEVETGANSGLTGSALDALLGPLDPVNVSEATRKLPNSILISEDGATAHRCAKAFAAVKVSAMTRSCGRQPSVQACCMPPVCLLPLPDWAVECPI